MKLELTRREKIIILFLLSLLALGATIHLVRNGATWNQPLTVTDK